MTWLWRTVIGTFGMTLALVISVSPAHANRFGPPWQSRVITNTTAYTQPDTSAPSVGPLWNGALVIVLGEPSSDWSSTTVGYVQTSDLREETQPWIAQVVVPSVSIYARPFAASGIRRTAKLGDLLRVTGVAPGLEGDSGIWWCTTEGYVDLSSLQPATSNWGSSWTLPDPSLATNGFWTRPVSAANVRAGPTTQAPIVGQFSGGERVKVLQQVHGQFVQGSDVWDQIDGGRYAGAYVHSSLLTRIAVPQANVTRPADPSVSAWIVVDRSAESLTFVRNGTPQFVTYVSLGEAGRQTPDGQYSTFLKFVADEMTSASVAGATDAYNLPNVPDTQYYLAGGYAIHGTYWHDLFGTNQSHGCINVTWTDGAYLFSLTQPTVPAGEIQASVTTGEATPVVIVN